jgi:hypothetical protein
VETKRVAAVAAVARKVMLGGLFERLPTQYYRVR